MLFTRLLPFFCLLLLSAVSVGQDYRRIPVVPSSCPVTKPDQPFVPQAPHPARPPFGRFWFGTDRLWNGTSGNRNMHPGAQTHFCGYCCANRRFCAGRRFATPAQVA